MSEEGKIEQSITGKYAASSATGDATITITNYYYREEVKLVPPDSTDAVDKDIPCPYRGLFHFGPNDAEVFFGRELFVEELYSATKTRNFISVLGASGSGKSSVVLAGLVPKLQKEGHWQFTHFRPGTAPFHAIALALVPLYTPNLDQTDQIAQARKLADYLQNGSVLLADVFAKIQQKHPNHRVLLIADQFEEVYTLCTSLEIRCQFLDCLLASLKNPTALSSATTVLVTTMRADFLGNALSYRPFADVLQNADVKLGPMNRKELTEAIEKPAQKLEVTFETGLVERILKDVENQPGNLPLLEFALTELWNKRADKQLTHKIYEDIGQVEGALARHADEKYGNLTEDEQGKVRRIFIQLVRPGEGTEDTRRVAMKAELGEQSWSLVRQLADARLVVTSRNLASQETVEVVHEALIRNWGELREWMNTNRIFRAWQERLRGAKGQWEATKKDQGSLLRGAALAEAEEKLRERSEDLIDEQEFITQSIQERNRQRRRKLITLTSFSVFASIFVLVAGLAGLGWWRTFINEKNYRLIASSQSSEALFSSNKQFEALLESIRTGKQMKKEFGVNPDTEIQVVVSLLQTVYGVKERNRFEGYNQQFIRSSFSSDGAAIAATNEDGSIRIWNLNGKEKTTINNTYDSRVNNGSYSVNSVSFSPKSNTIVGASQDGSIKLWDFDGKAIQDFTGKGKDAIITSISPDGTTIASVNLQGKIKVWKRNGQEVQTFQHPLQSTSWVTVLRFSPNGKIIASADNNPNSTVKLWSLQGKAPRDLKHDWAVSSLSFSSNSQMLASVEELSKVKIWDLNNGKQLDSFEDFGVTGSTFSPDGEIATFGSNAGNIKFWHSFNGKMEVNTTLTGHSSTINDVSFRPNDSNMLVSTSSDKTVKLWNLKGIKPPRFRPINGSLGDISISPNGQIIATVTADNYIKLWNLNGTPHNQLVGKASPLSKITFSSDGKYLVSSSQTLVQIWNIDSGESKIIIKQELNKGKRNDFGRASFSNDGKTIVVGREDGTVKLLRLDGAELQTLQGGGKIVSYSPNGEIIASASSNNNTVKLWNADGKELLSLLGSSYPITSFIFSPDGKTLIAGNANGNIIIWSITGKKLYTLQGHSSAVSSLTFRPDSKIFASASGNGSAEDSGTIKFWSVDGIDIKTFKTDSRSVSGINFSLDGKMLVWSNGGEVIMWNLDLDYLLSQGCDWVRDYLQNNSNVSESDRHLCDGIGTQK